jgi:hypothetical protein
VVEQQVKLVERLVGVMNSGNLEALDELFTEDFVDHDPLPGQPSGIEGLRVGLRNLAEQGDDPSFHLKDCFAAGDRVAYHIYGTWTVHPEFVFQDSLGPLAAMRLSGVGIYRCDGGRLAERWGWWSIQAQSEPMTVRVAVAPTGER